MLPFHFQTVSPLIKGNARLLFLTSGSEFGSTDIHDEHLIDRMDKFVGNVGNKSTYDLYDSIRRVPYPDLSREKTVGQSGSTDITLLDISRQNKSIEERYRRGLTDMASLRKLSDIATRYHISMARGFERHLVDLINNMDSEALNRKTVKPLV